MNNCFVDLEKNCFNPENRFIGDIEDGKRYPFDVYTKTESDERYASKSALDSKANEQECVAIRSRLDVIEEKESNFVTPEMFGAVGDGLTDDTDAFVDMFASSVTKIIFGDNKHYRVNVGNAAYLGTNGKRLILRSGMNVDLNGSMLETDWTYTFMAYNPNSAADAKIKGYNGASNIYIHDGRFKGVTMTFLHNYNVKIHNVDFLDTKAKHAIQLGACDRFEIKDCRFIGNKGVDKGALECINVEAADFTGQPYFPEGSATYDLTIPRNIVVDGCEFSPNLDDENYKFMGDGIGTHYVPANYTYDDDGKMTGATPLVNPFENITIRNCIFYQRETAVGQSSYNILVTYWKSVYISGNVFKGYRGIRLAAMYMACDDIHIVNNVFKDVSRPILFKSGNITNLEVSGNTWEKAPYKYSMFDFNSRQKTPIAQGDVTFTKCDGVRLVGTANTTSLTIDDCLQTDTFDRFLVEIGISAFYTPLTINSFTTHAYVKAQTTVPFVYQNTAFNLTYNPETYTFSVDGANPVVNKLQYNGELSKDGVNFAPDTENDQCFVYGKNTKNYSVSYFFKDCTLTSGNYVMSLDGDDIADVNLRIRKKNTDSWIAICNQDNPQKTVTISANGTYEIVLQVPKGFDVEEEYAKVVKCTLDAGVATPRIRMAYGFKNC